MSGKYDKVMEDKYASKSATFRNEPTFSTSNNLSSQEQFEKTRSDVEKEEREAVAQKKGLLARKFERIFGAMGNFQGLFIQGFKMGFIVGSIFGGLMGSYYAIAYRQFMYIPMSAIGSGSSFGFFMGIGSVMRSEMEDNSMS